MGCSSSGFIHQFNHDKFFVANLRKNLTAECKKLECIVDNINYDQNSKKVCIYVGGLTLDTMHDIFQKLRIYVNKTYPNVYNDDYEFILKQYNITARKINRRHSNVV
jgi:hypothetical protein